MGLDKEEMREGRVYVSLVPYLWERIILDEAHNLRNPWTLVSKAI